MISNQQNHHLTNRRLFFLMILLSLLHQMLYYSISVEELISCGPGAHNFILNGGTTALGSSQGVLQKTVSIFAYLSSATLNHCFSKSSGLGI
ncbi:hypothetical protein BDF14DRAFT_1840505 [Spinellus fusiger]|nr:hypothetical protein BDF14DRAFT_1840505 [Spinellus fusiger]